MNKLIFFAFIMLVGIGFSCNNPDPNVDEKGEDELRSLEMDHKIDKDEMAYQDIIYVPIYSNIYVDQQNQKSLLAATLSIRNTSGKDSLFISKIDYFNTEGDLIRHYINNPISLPPMGTINYVIEKDDDTGGSGANFIVALASKNKNVKPLIQAVMVRMVGNKGFSFMTDGYSVKE